MELKFKKLSEEAQIPVRAHSTDAGLDLINVGCETIVNEAREVMLLYHTDIAVEIPEGYVGLLFPRSSIYKKSLQQTNCVGVIDAGYRGEIKVCFRVTTTTVPEIYPKGEKFCQLVIVPIPNIEVVEVEELSESDRGEGGFGSTDENIKRNEIVENTNDQKSAADSTPVEESEATK